MSTEASSPAADDALSADQTEGLADDGHTAADDFDNTDAAGTGDEDDGGDADDPKASSPEGADLHEIEIDGEKHKVPATLRDAFMRTTDYTQKTQAHAETVRNWEAQRTQQAQNFEALRADIGKVAMLEQYVSSFEKVDWQAYFAKDPDAARRDYDQHRLLKDQLAEAKTNLSAKETARLEEQQAAEAQALQETGQELARDIKGWGPELGQKLVGFAAGFGVTPAELRGLNAGAWKILHAAYVGTEAQKQQQRTQQVEKTQATTPAKTVSAQRTPVRGLSDDLDDDAWLERRNAQAKAKARR